MIGINKNHNNMKSLLIFLLSVFAVVSGFAQQKNRLIVLTDIGGDPGDQMSMVRLMTYANHFDIEGLIATPHGPDHSVEPEYIDCIVTTYGEVRDNLEIHEPGYPTYNHQKL